MALTKKIGDRYYDFTDIRNNIVSFRSSTGASGDTDVDVDFANFRLTFIVAMGVDDFAIKLQNAKSDEEIASLPWYEWKKDWGQNKLDESLKSSPKEVDQSTELTNQDKYLLADLAWYFKGYVAAKVHEDRNDFGQPHVDVLMKVINNF